MCAPDEPVIPEFWYRLYPELRHFKSREELREVKKRFRKDAFAKRRTWAAMILIAVLGGGLSLCAARWLESLGLPLWFVPIINMIFCMFLGGALFLLFWHRPYIRFVRQYLQDHGTAVCLSCGFDLRGQTEPRCPECATAFAPKLLNTQQPMNAEDARPSEGGG